MTATSPAEPTVVLVHGALTDASVWRDVIRPRVDDHTSAQEDRQATGPKVCCHRLPCHSYAKPCPREASQQPTNLGLGKPNTMIRDLGGLLSRTR